MMLIDFFIIKSSADSLIPLSDLDKFITWSQQNRLPLNINKCNVSTLYRLENVITYDYTINNYIISRVISVKDLGIFIDCNMSFSLHINTITKKAFKLLGFINRNTKHFKNVNAFKNLLFSFIRFYLEFGPTACSLNYFNYKNIIENVQYKFFKLLGHTFLIC